MDVGHSGTGPVGSSNDAYRPIEDALRLAASQPRYSVEVAQVVAAGLIEQRKILVIAVRDVPDGYVNRAANLAKLNAQIETIDRRLESVLSLGQ